MAKMDRRTFVKSALAGAAGVALAGKGLAAPGGKPELVVLSGAGVRSGLDDAVAKLLEPLGGMKAFVRPGQKVLIKPNMGFPTPPEQRATTSPALVAAVVKQVLECKPSLVLVADNPVRRPEACIRTNGIREALQGLDVKLLLPTESSFFKKVDVPKGKSLRRVEIFREALEADVHIALPVAKSHNAAGYSGALKGMMGMILDRESFHGRYDLNQAIADLNTVIRPTLTILDGLEVMTTDGPAGPGKLVRTDTLLAGIDPVAVDARGVELAPLYGRNIKARQIKHLRFAQQMGVGRLSVPQDRVVQLKL
ncbi:MAG: DUF362 domain-containing protein [Deltaproteobacteria bacterium]|nr:MAG: DUF362 domain-containing protein [Deltaproteobacteria bacterium]